MDGELAIRSMVAPYQPRPVHLGGVLQIWVTRACDKACFGCTQGSNLGGKPGMITPEQYAEALESLRGYFGVVGMFGGNPAMHPQFEELCRILRDSWVPLEQRGIWCNHPRGKIKTIAETFYAPHSNLNVHMDQEAYDEFSQGWPESRPWLKGMDADSRHSAVYVALQDLIADEEVRWRLIANCDINRYWSALIGVFRGELAITGKREQVTAEHAAIYKPKVKDREVQVVTRLGDVQPGGLGLATDYIGNGRAG